MGTTRIFIAGLLLVAAQASRADDGLEARADSLHEARDGSAVSLSCTFGANVGGPGFRSTSSGSAGGNQPLETLLNEACTRCLAGARKCRLTTLTLAVLDQKTRKVTAYDIKLGEDIDASCPRENDQDARIRDRAKVTLVEKKKAEPAPVKPDAEPNPREPAEPRPELTLPERPWQQLPPFPAFPPRHGWEPLPIPTTPETAHAHYEMQRQAAEQWFRAWQRPHPPVTPVPGLRPRKGEKR